MSTSTRISMSIVSTRRSSFPFPMPKSAFFIRMETTFNWKSSEYASLSAATHPTIPADHLHIAARGPARERAIVRYAIALTERPDTIDIAALEAEGLTHEEILDLSHAVTIFAWANWLMLTLGEPVF